MYMHVVRQIEYICEGNIQTKTTKVIVLGEMDELTAIGNVPQDDFSLVSHTSTVPPRAWQLGSAVAEAI